MIDKHVVERTRRKYAKISVFDDGAVMLAAQDFAIEHGGYEQATVGEEAETAGKVCGAGVSLDCAI
jgi:hypothetical protein